MNKVLEDLKKNPRIELIPSLLNIPIMVAILVVLLVIPEVNTIRNDTAANIFKVEFDFVSVMMWVSALVLIFIFCLFLLQPWHFSFPH